MIRDFLFYIEQLLASPKERKLYCNAYSFSLGRLGGVLMLVLLLNSCQSNTTNKNQITIPSLNLKVDQYEVSIADFGTFINEQKYVTTSDSIGWSGVYNSDSLKWDMATGANWQKPTGQKVYDDNYPATHISYMDACVYCKWKNGRLPTAPEWDKFAGDEIIKGNVWEGTFPFDDSGKDGYPKSIAPIGQFTPNKYGIHDLFGNVWEWTSTEKIPNSMIIKGGSFLCDISYCSGYIPSKFQTTAKDSGLNHLGFRCVYD
jgi:sulfatase modifying factor 1